MKYRALLTLLALTGCGGDPVSPSAWADVSGIHEGDIVSLSLPLNFAGTMTLDIEQTDSALSGTFAYDITIDPGGQEENLVGRGTLDGTIARGSLPAIELEFADNCDPDTLVGISSLVGGYTTTAKRTSLRGRFAAFSAECEFRGGQMITMRLAHSG